jgi:prevent-host-death family protein
MTEIGVAALRSNLSEWLDRARDGEEVVVTERGVPVARLVGVKAAGTIERLTAEGVIARPDGAERPKAHARQRVRSRRSVSDVVSDQRR